MHSAVCLHWLVDAKHPFMNPEWLHLPLSILAMKFCGVAIQVTCPSHVPFQFILPTFSLREHETKKKKSLT